MNDCMNAEVRDALPDLMHGRLSDLDRATMKAHVETCADCREELRLLEEVRASAPLAPKIDVSRIVAALPAPMPSAADQLVASQPERVRRQSSPLLKMVAVAALLVTGSLTFATVRSQRSETAPASSSVAAAPVPASAASTQESVVAIAQPAPASVVESSHTAGKQAVGLSLTGGVQDLSDEQLQSLVDGLDDVEALPSSEPEPLTISVDEDGLQ